MIGPRTPGRPGLGHRGQNMSISGGSGNDSLTGTSGSEQINGQDGNDTIAGGDGNDSIWGGTGNDSLRGGNGDDRILGDAGNDTLWGDAGNDTLFGGDDRDVFGIAAGHGRDSIFGGEFGVDQDEIWFQNGGTNHGVNVTFSGSEQGSYIFTDGTTQGTFVGIEGMSGTSNADSINASASLAPQQLRGEGGNDTITGGSGFDSLDGGTGDDSLTGGAGNDTLLGGAGNDTLWGGAGNDSLFGGDDSDVFGIVAGQGRDSVFGGETGIDQDEIWFQSGGTNQGVNVTFSGAEQGSYIFTDGTTQGTFVWIEGMSGTNNADSINASASSAAQQLRGEGGNDTITGGWGNDSLDGGTGDDSLTGGAGNDTLLGGAGNDQLIGGAGNDSLSGNAGNDTLWGNAGNDTLFGGADMDAFNITNGDGSDQIFGGEDGEDFDQIWFSTWQSSEGVNVTFTGSEQGSYAYSGGQTTGTFQGIEGISGTQNADRLDASASARAQQLYGLGGRDTLGGGSGNDILDGGDGDDVLSGGVGGDSLYGGAGNDTIVGDSDDRSPQQMASTDLGSTERVFVLVNDSAAPIDLFWIDHNGFPVFYASLNPGESVTHITFPGHNWAISDPEGGHVMTYLQSPQGTVRFAPDLNDEIFGGDGSDILVGGAGADTIFGGAGTDFVFGGSGDDVIHLGAGDDYVFGGTGADQLFGGDGRDMFIVTGQDGNDTIDGGEGGNDFDILLFDKSDPGPQGVRVTFTGDEQGTYSLGPGLASGSFSGIEGVAGTHLNDMIDASASTRNQEIWATSGDDTVIGGSGDDLIDGAEGDDSLVGGAGSDTLTGEDGNDTLEGGAGDDALSGGAGADTFVLTLAGGHDRISDFDMTLVDGQTIDRLDVSDLRTAKGEPLRWRDITVSDDGQGNAVLTFPQGESVVLEGVSPNDIQSKQQMNTIGVPCFTPGTRILTSRGEVRIERLRPGDLVMTADNGPQPLRWVARRHLDAATLTAMPWLRPILLADGAAGNRRPLLVSPQHRMMLGGRHEAFLRAALWQRLPGVGGARRAGRARGDLHPPAAGPP
jgi:Ca2+-binding RTX toxin-like protein